MGIIEESKKDFGAPETMTYEAIQVGAVQRIAAAAEKMAQSFDDLRQSRDYWKNEAESARSKEEKLRRSNAALRGVITKYERLIRKLRGQT